MQREVHDRLKGVKGEAVVNAQQAFSSASKELQYDIFDKIQAKGLEAKRYLNNSSYQQNAICKALIGMLELSMATIYKDAMSNVVKTDF